MSNKNDLSINDEIENTQLNDMKICQPDEYELTWQSIAPDRKLHQCVYNSKKYRVGYVHNKLNLEDDSWYAPYLIYKIGKKIGIDVSETEIALLLHKNINRTTYSDSLFESSIVYNNDTMYNAYIRLDDNIAYVSPEVLRNKYLMHLEDENDRKLSHGAPENITVDEYIDSYIWYLTTHGNKSQNEYSKEEIDSIKQELIDRILFSLRFESRGNFNVRLVNFQNASLEPYYYSGFNMYYLGESEKGIQDYLKMTDQELKKSINRSFKPQYTIPNTEKKFDESDQKNMLRYIFKKYPKQAENFYKKLSSFEAKDLEDILDTCTRMSDNHKKIAVRIFETRGKDFEEIHQEYMKKQEDDGR